MTTKSLTGLYVTLHGARGERGATIYGGDKMVLCGPHAMEAVEFAEASWDHGFILKAARPFKVHLIAAASRPCEAC